MHVNLVFIDYITSTMTAFELWYQHRLAEKINKKIGGEVFSLIDFLFLFTHLISSQPLPILLEYVMRA